MEKSKRLEIHQNPITHAFQDYLGDKTGRITPSDAWTILGMEDAGRRTQDQNRRFGAALRALGFGLEVDQPLG